MGNYFAHARGYLCHINQTKLYHIMATAFTISPRVIDTISSLSVEDRDVITTALARELILGKDVTTEMSPMQAIIYAIVRFYVNQDSAN